MHEFLSLLVEVALAIAVPTIALLGGQAVMRLSDWLGLQADDKVRRYLQDIVDLAVGTAADKLHLPIPGVLTPEAARARMVGDAAAYIAARVPDALKRFGIDDKALRDMIEIRLPQPTTAPADF